MTVIQLGNKEKCHHFLTRQTTKETKDIYIYIYIKLSLTSPSLHFLPHMLLYVSNNTSEKETHPSVSSHNLFEKISTPTHLYKPYFFSLSQTSSQIFFFFNPLTQTRQIHTLSFLSSLSSPRTKKKKKKI